MTAFLENGEWELLDTPLIRHVNNFLCCVEPYPTLEFQMIIKRKSLYYVTNLILPCAFSTICALLVFWLPPESGEKVALSVTILLTVTVFLLMVAEAMPAQSLVIPIICKHTGCGFFCIIYIIIFFFSVVFPRNNIYSFFIIRIDCDHPQLPSSWRFERGGPCLDESRYLGMVGSHSWNDQDCGDEPGAQ